MSALKLVKTRWAGGDKYEIYHGSSYFGAIFLNECPGAGVISTVDPDAIGTLRVAKPLLATLWLEEFITKEGM